MENIVSSKQRQDWIDGVKGVTISLVVLHHVLEGVHRAIGLDDTLLSVYNVFAPYRMPLFFLVAGFFAKKSLHDPIELFSEKKLFHFAYFYILWSFISVVVRTILDNYTNAQNSIMDFADIFWKPPSSLWFLYALFIAFIVARITRNVPIYIQLATAIAIALGVKEIYGLEAPVFFIEVLKLYPMFLIGIYFSVGIRSWVKQSQWHTPLIIWACYVIVAFVALFSVGPQNAGFYYTLAGLGSFAVMTTVYQANNSSPAKIFHYIGRRSLYVYLLHFLPAAGVRVIGMKMGLADYPLAIIVLGTPISIAFCIGSYEIVKRIPVIKYIFIRPSLKALFNQPAKSA